MSRFDWNRFPLISAAPGLDGRLFMMKDWTKAGDPLSKDSEYFEPAHGYWGWVEWMSRFNAGWFPQAQVPCQARVPCPPLMEAVESAQQEHGPLAKSYLRKQRAPFALIAQDGLSLYSLDAIISASISLDNGAFWVELTMPLLVGWPGGGSWPWAPGEIFIRAIIKDPVLTNGELTGWEDRAVGPIGRSVYSDGSFAPAAVIGSDSPKTDKFGVTHHSKAEWGDVSFD